MTLTLPNGEHEDTKPRKKSTKEFLCSVFQVRLPKNKKR